MTGSTTIGPLERAGSDQQPIPQPFTVPGAEPPVGTGPIVDAHTHIFPPEICEARLHYAPHEPWFEHLYENPGAMLVQAEALVASMREAGIGELNADAQEFDFREPELLAPVVEVCQSAGKPVLFHVSEPLGHAYPGKGTATPERFVRFLARYPDLPVVAAHWGGGLPFYELMPEIASLARNVVYDSAASTYLYRFAVFRAVLDIVGPERVLMASDYPILRQRRFLRRTLAADLHSWEMPLVLGRNAVRVYDLPEGGSGS